MDANSDKPEGIVAVTLKMPLEAAEKIMSNRAAAIEYLKRQGFDVVDIRLPTYTK